jgi:hypothetical protein
MIDIFGTKTGGPKYRDNIHDFKAAVFGYSLAGVVAMVVIHSVVLSTPAGHQKWIDVLGPVSSAAMTK